MRPSGLLAGGVAIALGFATAIGMIAVAESKRIPSDRPLITNFNQKR